MTCSKCGHENRTGAKYCGECGAHLALICANCGAQLSPTAKFCSECGHPAGTAAPSTSSSSSSRFGAPETYTPGHLAEKILTSKAALEGERKQVTVLFADLKSSMELFADRDPEEARKLLDPVLDHMMEAVHRFEGTVNHVMGDGIMALFGAPLAHEDHAVRACYAALRMQESVKRYAADIRRSEGIPIQIRVGLNSGEVVVRSIGSDLRMEYTVVGQTANVAARMEQMAVPGSILISPDTQALAEGYVQVKPLGPSKVKGLALPLEVFEVTGASKVRTRLDAAAARGLTRFVGRDTELVELGQALERARSGHGQVVAVVGEPGVGKSRLYWEFTHSHRTQGWLIVESRSVSYGKATAFLPIIELLRVYFQIEAGDEARKIREKLTGKLLSLDRALQPSLPALLWLLDVPIEDPQWHRLDPPQRRLQALEGVKRLLFRESQVQPLLLLFEDLHWIDAETQALLDSLVESLPTNRTLLLVNYRPEYEHAWSGKTYYVQLRIDPLRPESSEELLDAVLGEDPTLEPLKRALIARTDGNPFFLEESVRTLVETKVLVGERGTYKVARTPDAWRIPATAQALLAARIDRLLPEDKRLLQAAAVIGKDVPYTLLQAIADVSEDALRRTLNHLQTAAFLYETSLFPELEYTFKHAFIHEVAYGGVLQDRRRFLHARILAAMQDVFPDRLADHVERLAHHAVRGRAWDQAVTFLRQAGAKAFARSANRDAVAHYEEALSVQQHLPQSRTRDEDAVDLRFELRSALMVLGEFPRTLTVLREAQDLAKVLGDIRRLGWAAGYLSNLLWEMGKQDEAIGHGQEALDIAARLDDTALKYLALRYLGRCYHAIGQYRQGVETFHRALASVELARSTAPPGRPNPSVNSSRHFAALCLMELGAFPEAIEYALAALSAVEGVDQAFNLAGSCAVLGYVHLRRGDVRKAIPLLERGVELCRSGKIPVLFPFAASPLGAAYAMSDRIAEALQLLEHAVNQAASMRRMVDLSLHVAWHSEVLLLANRTDDAKESALRALELALVHKERGYQAWILRLLGEIQFKGAPRQSDEAEAYFEQALVLGDELGMDPLRAHCLLGLGAVYERTGRRERACTSLSTAGVLYRTMGMTFWLPQTEAALKRLGASGGPEVRV
jgi:class 3 adenylate cyclase/tetratricopeptide (TPR) repeat protein